MQRKRISKGNIYSKTQVTFFYITDDHTLFCYKYITARVYNVNMVGAVSVFFRAKKQHLNSCSKFNKYMKKIMSFGKMC